MSNKTLSIFPATAIFAFRGGSALLALAAIIGQYIRSAQTTALNNVNFFSYFTIDANLLAAAAFIMAAYYTLKEQSSPSWLDIVRGGAVVYMACTGIVFALLLRGTADETVSYLKWADDVLHVLFPLIVVLDWIVLRPRTVLSWPQAAIWLIYPLIWLVYTLIRGAATSWYPYPFLAPNPGYGTVALYCFAILVLMGLLCAAARAFKPKIL